MGSKTSVKSKSQHLASHQMLPFKNTTIEWVGNGIYMLNRTAGHFVPVLEMQDLCFKMTNQNYGAPLYVRKDVDGVLVWFNPAS